MQVFCFCDNMRDIYLATCPDESVREEMGIRRERDMRLGKQEEKRGSNGERPGSHGEKRVSNGEKRVSYGEKGVSYGEKRGDRCLVINSHWTSAAKAAPIEQVDSQHCFQPSSHDNRPVIGVTLATIIITVIIIILFLSWPCCCRLRTAHPPSAGERGMRVKGAYHYYVLSINLLQASRWSRCSEL